MTELLKLNFQLSFGLNRVKCISNWDAQWVMRLLLQCLLSYFKTILERCNITLMEVTEIHPVTGGWNLVSRYVDHP